MKANHLETIPTAYEFLKNFNKQSNILGTETETDTERRTDRANKRHTATKIELLSNVFKQLFFFFFCLLLLLLLLLLLCDSCRSGFCKHLAQFFNVFAEDKKRS
uniref:Uncharacterized protein n=1 Tax=Glossina austeni TaxID=7395 RepID=A0A1A9VV93_GLOAU